MSTSVITKMLLSLGRKVIPLYQQKEDQDDLVQLLFVWLSPGTWHISLLSGSCLFGYNQVHNTLVCCQALVCLVITRLLFVWLSPGTQHISLLSGSCLFGYNQVHNTLVCCQALVCLVIT
ncbi:hypothetical protein KUTeg_014050, partial [Tegillarca granosa]